MKKIPSKLQKWRKKNLASIQFDGYLIMELRYLILGKFDIIKLVRTPSHQNLCHIYYKYKERKVSLFIITKCQTCECLTFLGNTYRSYLNEIKFHLKVSTHTPDKLHSGVSSFQLSTFRFSSQLIENSPTKERRNFRVRQFFADFYFLGGNWRKFCPNLFKILIHEKNSRKTFISVIIQHHF